MEPTLHIVAPDPINKGLWAVETPDGERLRGVTHIEITLDVGGDPARAVVTFIGVHVDVHAKAERQVKLVGVDEPYEPGEAPDFVSEVTLPTDAS